MKNREIDITVHYFQTQDDLKQIQNIVSRVYIEKILKILEQSGLTLQEKKDILRRNREHFLS